MTLAYRMTSKSLPWVGRHFGGRDHTTILNAIKKVKQRIVVDPQFAAKYMMIRERVMRATFLEASGQEMEEPL